MRFYEFKIIEAPRRVEYRPIGIKIDDGAFFITSHYLDRINERDITPRRISSIIHRAIDLHRDKLLSIGTDDFVIKERHGIGMGISKVLQVDDSFKYIIRTVCQDLKVGKYQYVIWL